MSKRYFNHLLSQKIHAEVGDDENDDEDNLDEKDDTDEDDEELLLLKWKWISKQVKNSFFLIPLLLLGIFWYIYAADTYSDELKWAYNYAYNIHITTQSSIDTADMYGSLIRVHMAKMMVNYAKQVLGKTPDNLLPCNFADVADQTTELQWYIKEACKLGLMWVNMVEFNPNGKVTRAEFGTVLSRALYGNMYDTGSPYYAKHLQALKTIGIMKNIQQAEVTEIRGYVMLMLQRTSISLHKDGYGYGATSSGSVLLTWWNAINTTWTILNTDGYGYGTSA